MSCDVSCSPRPASSPWPAAPPPTSRSSRRGRRSRGGRRRFCGRGARRRGGPGGASAGEGPAWDPQLGVLTSGKDGIHRLARDGTSRVWRKDARTNGLLFDREGRLVCCEPERRRVTRIDRDGKLTVLTDRFEGK